MRLAAAIDIATAALGFDTTARGIVIATVTRPMLPRALCGRVVAQGYMLESLCNIFPTACLTAISNRRTIRKQDYGEVAHSAGQHTG